MNDRGINTSIKKETNNTLRSILLFILVYILTITAALSIACFFAYIGLNIIARADMFLITIVGIGIAGIGVVIVLFILNFLFPKAKQDHPTMTEITAKEEPELFKLLHKIASQAYARPPKKVFLTHDVYAAVFSRLNIIDLFFNRRKNLIIGIGLINMISEKEFEALLAHEFGHTTQKSTRVRILFNRIHNMVSEMVDQASEFKKDTNYVSNNIGFLGLFATIGNKINEVISDLLVKAYYSIVKNFNSLSREMEYQADEIASKIAGYKANESLLIKFELASESFNSAINFYQFSPNPFSSENIYENQKHVMSSIANKQKLQIENNMPIVDMTTLNKIQFTKINLESQFSTHPSIEDRLKWIKQKASSVPNNFKPASDYFSDFSNTQKTFSKMVFEKLFEYDNDIPALSIVEFQNQFDLEIKAQSFPKIFNAYYDDLFKISFHKEDDNCGNSISIVQELFTDENTRIKSEYVILFGDIFAIENLDKSIKYIDYDGKKYIKKNFEHLLTQLRTKKSELEEQIRLNDLKILETAINTEKKQNLPSLIKGYFDMTNKMEMDISELSQALFETRQAFHFLAEQLGFDLIKAHLKDSRITEIKLKELINDFLNDENYHPFIESETRDILTEYANTTFGYFYKNNYIDANIEKLAAALNSLQNLLETVPISIKKHVLNYLAELLTGDEKR